MASKSKKNPHNNVALHTTNHRKSIMITSGNGTARSVKHDLAGCNFSDVGNTGCLVNFLAYGWANNLPHICWIPMWILYDTIWPPRQSGWRSDTICIYLHLFASICIYLHPICTTWCICLHQFATPQLDLQVVRLVLVSLGLLQKVCTTDFRLENSRNSHCASNSKKGQMHFVIFCEVCEWMIWM